MENLPTEFVKHRVFNIKKIFFYILGTSIFLVFFYSFFLRPPADFPIGSIINIEPGMNLRNVSLQLKQEHIISSRVALEAFVTIYGGEKHLIPADYLFEGKELVWEVARRIVRGERHLAPVKVTIPEGFNVSEISDAFVLKLANFNKEKFLSLAQTQEGYLFPDTYFFFTTDTEVEALDSMSKNFEKKIASVRPEIISSGKKERDIIIMASIIEKESKGDNDRKIISGILWKRLAINMPLQVDAAPGTYKTRGLVKNPISNPGLEAIKATIFPQSSPYLYYLHDKDGNIHYARTFTEHRQNILKYLNKK